VDRTAGRSERAGGRARHGPRRPAPNASARADVGGHGSRPSGQRQTGHAPPRGPSAGVERADSVGVRAGDDPAGAAFGARHDGAPRGSESPPTGTPNNLPASPTGSAGSLPRRDGAPGPRPRMDSPPPAMSAHPATTAAEPRRRLSWGRRPAAARTRPAAPPRAPRRPFDYAPAARPEQQAALATLVPTRFPMRRRGHARARDRGIDRDDQPRVRHRRRPRARHRRVAGDTRAGGLVARGESQRRRARAPR